MALKVMREKGQLFGVQGPPFALQKPHRHKSKVTDCSVWVHISPKDQREDGTEPDDEKYI